MVSQRRIMNNNMEILFLVLVYTPIVALLGSIFDFAFGISNYFEVKRGKAKIRQMFNK
jgi:hypothetical protein